MADRTRRHPARHARPTCGTGRGAAAGHPHPWPDRLRGQPLHPERRAASARLRLSRAAAQRARRRPVAAVLPRALSCRSHGRFPARAVADPRGADEQRHRRGRLLAGRRHAAEISRRGGLVLAAARCRHDLRADRSRAHRPAHDAAAQLALSHLHPERHEGRGAGRRCQDLAGGARHRARRRAACGNTTSTSSRRATASAAPTTTTTSARPCTSCRRSVCRPWCWRQATIRGFPSSTIASSNGPTIHGSCR